MEEGSSTKSCGLDRGSGRVDEKPGRGWDSETGSGRRYGPWKGGGGGKGMT